MPIRGHRRRPNPSSYKANHATIWPRHWDGTIIAVIVSGYDGDGADALCGIKEVGGITIAQKLETASQPDMPASAIASGCIDFVLSPEDIAQKIGEIAFK